MKIRHFSIILVMLLGVFASAMAFTGGAGGGGLGNQPQRASTPTLPTNEAYPDAYKLAPRPPAELPVPRSESPALTHPCPGMLAEPLFSGISPLAIAYVPGMCNNGYGDIAVWQANGHNYVAQSGFALRMFHLWNVDDPYNPQILITQPFPSGGTASTALFHFKQTYNSNTHQYLAITMRGSGQGCGYFIYNVDDPSNPQFIVRKSGTDWCTVHETFVSSDTNGSADYAWLTMSGESGSGYKIVALTLPDLSQPNPVLTETGRYQRPDSCGGLCIFVHDSNVVGNRVFVAHWLGGMLIFDKETLAHTIQPTPLNPIDSIRPANFQVHHTVPTTDGKFAFIEDEFINDPSLEKIKVYNITDVANPVYAGGIIGSGNAASSQAHNMIIQPISAGHDRLYVGWYKAGMRMYEVDTTGSTPVITETGMHQLRDTTGSGFGGVWGVDYLPCTLHGKPSTCIYSSDYEKFGLIVDALGYDSTLDPYPPDAAITSPSNGQQITGCTFTIQGTGHDYYSGLAQVEVSTDGGGTWHPATGTDNWSYQWSIPGDGSYNLKVRATDLAGNAYISTSQVTVGVDSCSVITATPPPATNTSTRTPTTQPTPTIGPPCGYLFQGATTSCLVTDYDYSFSFYEESGCTGGSGTANLTFYVSPNMSGTWTLYDTQTRNVTVTHGPNIVTVEGSLNEPTVPSSYSYYYIGLSGGVGGGSMNGYTNPHALCQTVSASPTATPNGPTVTPIRPSATATHASATSTRTPGQVTTTATSVSPTGTSTAVEATITSTAGTPIATATSTSCPIQFTDVPPDNIFYPFIRCLVCRGVMSGYEDDTFRPYNNVTRGQTAKMVSNAAGYDDVIPPDRQNFEDVPPGSTFWLWVERLVLHGPPGGIMGGYPCGGEGEPCGPNNLPYFRPYASSTRGQAAKIISNAAGYDGDPGPQVFTDVPVTNPFFVYIGRLASYNVMSGYQCGGPGEPCDSENRAYFRPFATITRAQLAKIIANTWFPNCVTPARP